MKINTYLKPLTALAVASFLSVPTAFANENPWRLSKAIGLPDWLQISGEHRVRYETLDEQFRATTNGVPGNGGDQILVLRTLLHAKVDLDFVRFGAEMEDSRIELADTGTASSSNSLTTTIANSLELLQAYIEIPVNDLFVPGSKSLLRGGRITMDVGSRRLIARNRFRNTINAFTGVDWQWQAADKTFRAFYTLPVQRLNSGDIRDNHNKFDREHSEVRFWGVYYSQNTFSEEDKAEAFLFTIDEEDAPGWNTSNRELYTFGMRFWREPKIGQFDYQFEGAYQLGESKASSSSTQTLDHWAHFHHAEIGYSFDAPLSPHLIVQYDYASGDDNPNDGENNRFDTLYGARRFDFGPTSIYGPFARANINSPGLRLNMKPYKNVSSMFALRGFWRASTNDAWTGAGIKGTDAYIGTQIEARLRWDIVPKNIRLEGGVAHIFAGDLMDEAGKKDTTYAYTQLGLQF